MSQRNARTKSCKNCLSSARQNASVADPDIISTLPDSLLTHILSYLSIRESVATSILSSRWRTLWTLVPQLHLIETDLNRPNLNLSFVDIVSRIWTLRNAIPNPMPLHTLSIVWLTHCHPFYVDTWVRATIPHGLKELCLNICNDTLLDFPRSVFFSTTLVALKLAGNFSLNPPSGASFPSLRILHLALLNYANSESLSAILTACPVLQDLCLYVFLRKDQGNFNIVVQVPTLKRMYLCCFNYNFQSSSFKVHINTPALEYLIFKGHLVEDVVFENLSHLVALVLQVEIVNGVSTEDDAKRVWDLIRPLAHVKSLSLSTKTTEILSHAFGDNVPMFHNLFSLKFNGCLYFEWHAIRFLLGRAPKLQILAFESCPELAEHSYGQPTPDSSWEEPLDVPECLSSHLTTCHYKGFLGDKDEMQLVRQILKVARVLKTLKITVDGHLESEEKLRVCEALSTIVQKFPKSSQTCEIAYDERALL